MIIEKGSRHPFPVVIDLDDSDSGRDQILEAIQPMLENYFSESNAQTIKNTILSQYEFYKFVEATDDLLGEFVTFLISKPIEEY